MDLIARDRCVVLDGATGTELIEVAGDRPEREEHLWGLSAILDTPDDVIAERMSRRALDRFEAESHAFHDRVLDGYRTMAGADPGRWITVQAIGSIGTVTDQILSALAGYGVSVGE